MPTMTPRDAAAVIELREQCRQLLDLTDEDGGMHMAATCGAVTLELAARNLRGLMQRVVG